jgi:hypothetical protein
MTKQEVIAEIRAEVEDMKREAERNKTRSKDALGGQFWNGKVFAALDILHVLDDLEEA